ncbi:hypothetical protein K474DRAFT_1678291 [Panus rudis PR-1116 ss-1]|nr:hypothetical protein K474DRAFT_1678291 [Panus rudis PR-1116 ss-1]
MQYDWLTSHREVEGIVYENSWSSVGDGQRTDACPSTGSYPANALAPQKNLKHSSRMSLVDVPPVGVGILELIWEGLREVTFTGRYNGAPLTPGTLQLVYPHLYPRRFSGCGAGRLYVMRFANLLAFTLASVAYAAAFTIPLVDGSTHLTDKLPPSTLLSRDYIPPHEARDKIDELVRRYDALKSRDDAGAEPDFQENLLKRAPEGDEPNHLGLYEYGKDGRARWLPQKKPTSTIIETQPEPNPPHSNRPPPQRQGSWQMNYGYQQGAPPPGNWPAAAHPGNYYPHPNPNGAPQAPVTQYPAHPQDQRSHRRPSMSYGVPATYHQPQAAAPAQAGYGHPGGAVAVPHAGYQAGAVSAAYGYPQQGVVSYGHTQQVSHMVQAIPVDLLFHQAMDNHL